MSKTPQKTYKEEWDEVSMILNETEILFYCYTAWQEQIAEKLKFLMEKNAVKSYRFRYPTLWRVLSFTLVNEFLIFACKLFETSNSTKNIYRLLERAKSENILDIQILKLSQDLYSKGNKKFEVLKQIRGQGVAHFHDIDKTGLSLFRKYNVSTKDTEQYLEICRNLLDALGTPCNKSFPRRTGDQIAALKKQTVDLNNHMIFLSMPDLSI